MKKIRITIELPGNYIKLLNAKCQLSGYMQWMTGGEDDNPPQLDAGAILSLLVLCEARGAPEADIHAATPMEWRNGGPVLIHEERRVYDNDTGEQLGGPVLEEATNKHNGNNRTGTNSA